MRDSTTTQCVLFEGVFRKPVHARFDQAHASSDGGAIVLAAADRQLGLIDRLAECLDDPRDATKRRPTATVQREQHSPRPSRDGWPRLLVVLGAEVGDARGAGAAHRCRIAGTSEAAQGSEAQDPSRRRGYIRPGGMQEPSASVAQLHLRRNAFDGLGASKADSRHRSFRDRPMVIRRRRPLLFVLGHVRVGVAS